MNPFKFLMAAPDATQKVPQEKIAATYKWRQAGVLFSAPLPFEESTSSDPPLSHAE